MAADFDAVADDGPELFQSGGCGALRRADDDFAFVQTHIGKNDTGSQVSTVAEDGVADVIEVGNLCPVEDDAIFELTGVSENNFVADDDVFADVTTGANMTAVADPGGSFDHGALLDDRAVADVNGIADEGAAHLFAVDGGLQAELQIGGNERQCFPNVCDLVKKRPVVGVGQIEIFVR